MPKEKEPLEKFSRKRWGHDSDGQRVIKKTRGREAMFVVE